jgi:hypothetical protein
MSTPLPTAPLTDWLTAIGTLLAVVVALLIAFLGAIQSKINEPKLELEIENKEPCCRHAEIIDDWVEINYIRRHPQSYFLRLRVRNKGKSVARHVEVRLVRILDVDSRKERTDYDPTHLNWVGYGLSNYISIPRGLYEYVNVGYVKDTLNKFILSTTETAPRGFPTVRERYDCIFHIIAVGSNAKPIERYFKLHFGSSFEIKYDDVTLTMISHKKYNPAKYIQVTPISSSE